MPDTVRPLLNAIVLQALAQDEPTATTDDSPTAPVTAAAPFSPPTCLSLPPTAAVSPQNTSQTPQEFRTADLPNDSGLINPHHAMIDSHNTHADRAPQPPRPTSLAADPQNLRPDADGSDADPRLELLHRALARKDQELHHKDELVVRLTEQLEMTAEQLDRLQRQGGDRRRGAGALPAEVVDEHRSMLSEMQRVVQQWEDLQTGLVLGRIEVQLGELRDFIADRLDGETTSRLAVNRESSAERFHKTTEHAERHSADSSAEATVPWSARPSGLPPGAIASLFGLNTTGAGESAPPSDTSVAEEPADFSFSQRRVSAEISDPQPAPSAWEQLKSQLLTGEASSDGGPAIDSLPAPQLPHVPAAPSPIDLANATREDLVAAVIARDDHTLALLQRLRVVEDANFAQAWREAAESSPTVAEHLQSVSQRMEEALRLSEVEFSMERARLAREQARLALLQQSLDKQARELGLGVGPGPSETGARKSASATDRRWVRFLGGRQG